MLYLLSVWLHILAAIVWIGGMVFFALVAVPVIRRGECRSDAPALIRLAGIRFRAIGWTCIAVLVATGILNLAYQGTGWENIWFGGIWQGPQGLILVLKLSLVVVVIGLSVVHDFLIGPQSAQASVTEPGSPNTLRLSRWARWLARLNLLLSLAIVFLAVILVRGSPW